MGYDLYRRPLASCDPQERLTALPWSRDSGQHFTRTLVDHGRPPGVAYAGCGSIEGCEMAVESFTVQDCSVPVAPGRTWGEVKGLYR